MSYNDKLINKTEINTSTRFFLRKWKDSRLVKNNEDNKINICITKFREVSLGNKRKNNYFTASKSN